MNCQVWLTTFSVMAPCRYQGEYTSQQANSQRRFQLGYRSRRAAPFSTICGGCSKMLSWYMGGVDFGLCIVNPSFGAFHTCDLRVLLRYPQLLELVLKRTTVKPGWQVQQKWITEHWRFTSLMRLPQRGHGWPALPCTSTRSQSRTSTSIASLTRSRSVAIASLGNERMAA